MFKSQKQKIVDAYNVYVAKAELELFKYHKDIDQCFVYGSVDIFTANNRIDSYDFEHNLIKMSKKDLEQYIADKYTQVDKDFVKLRDDFKYIKQKIEDNKQDFDYFVNHFSRGFVTIVDIATNTYRYMYVEEFIEKCDEGENVDLYGILSEYQYPIKVTVNPKTHKLLRMSRCDYDCYYLPNRVEHCGISDECKLHEYVENLTEKFQLLSRLS